MSLSANADHGARAVDSRRRAVGRLSRQARIRLGAGAASAALATAVLSVPAPAGASAGATAGPAGPASPAAPGAYGARARLTLHAMPAGRQKYSSRK